MRSKLFRNRLLPVTIILFSYILFISWFTLSNYKNAKQRILNGIDLHLLETAFEIKQLLPADFHDRATAPGTISSKEDLKNIETLSARLNPPDLVYLWTTVVNNSGVFMTSCSALDHERNTGTEIRYFDAYPEASQEMYNAFENMSVQYVNHSDRWGHFRSVFLPQTSPNGHVYLSCATTSTDFVDHQLAHVSIVSILIALGFIILSFPIIFLFRNNYKDYNNQLLAINERLSEEVSNHITTQKRLSSTEERFRKLFNDNNDPQILFRDNQIIEANQKAQNIFEYNLDDFEDAALSFFDVLAPESKTLVEEKIRSIHESDKPTDTFVIKATSRSGTPLTFDVNLSMITWYSQPHVLASLRDIRDKIRLQNEMEHASRMETVGLLAGGIAHDFNNLLTAVASHAELGLMQTDKEAPIRENLKEIIHTTGRAGGLIQQLLTFSRSQPSQRQNIEIPPLIQQLMSMVHPVLGVNISSKVNLTDSILPVFADLGQIEQVLLNLVINARDAMPEGGILTISAENYFHDGGGNFDLKRGEYVRLSIRDTGTGIEQEILDKIFNPFFTTKAEGKGTGLGLATVYKIVHEHDGTIIVDSIVGRGTTFTLFFPASPQEAPKSTIISEHKLSEAHDEHVIVIEDATSVREAVSNTLKRFGYRVTAFSDGAAALRETQQMPHAADLIITDVIMPNLNGPDVVQVIRAFWPNVHVLYMSGHSDERLLASAVLRKGYPFLRKPFTPSALLRKIETIFAEETTIAKNRNVL